MTEQHYAKAELDGWRSFSIVLSERKDVETIGATLAAILTELKARAMLECFFASLGSLSLQLSLKTAHGLESAVISCGKELSRDPAYGNLIGTVSLHYRGRRFPEKWFFGSPEVFLNVEKSSMLILRLSKLAGDDSLAKFNFSLYLHLGWLKTLAKARRISIADVMQEGYSVVAFGGHKDYGEEGLRDLYGKHSGAVRNIFATVMSNSVFITDHLPFMVSRWLELFEDTVLELQASHESGHYQHDLARYYVPFLINKHLGLSQGEIVVQMYFLNAVCDEKKVV